MLQASAGLAAAAAAAAPIAFGTAGVGPTEHLTAEFVFRPLGGLDAVHVPYAGGVAPVAATVAQQVDMAVTTIPTAFGHIKANALRVLAVASRARIPLMPDVPTLKEAGLADFENSSWIGIFGPPGLPPAIGRRLNEEVNVALMLPEVRQRLGTLGFEPRGGSQQAIADYVREEIAKWGKVIQAIAIKPA